MLATVLLLFLACGHVANASLKIGSFNVKRLYTSKAQDTHVVSLLAQILSQYDISVVLEVMHTEAIQTVLAEMNRHGGLYSISVGPASGRHSYKEHIAFIYRNDKVTLTGTDLYPDPDDEFEREPYTAAFHTTHTSLTSFAIMGVHLKPSDVFDEMDSTVDAYNHAVSKLHIQNMLIAGDFNADCSYLSAADYHRTLFYTDSRFYFLVYSNADTTTSHNTNCAYDRFVSAGSAMRAAVVPGSVRVYNIETELRLSFEQAWNVSDHYPIQLELQ